MRRLLLPFALLLAACEGSITAPSHGPGSPSGPGPGPGPMAGPCDEGGAEALVAPRVRRLLSSEYHATVARLGVTMPTSNLFPNDPTPNGYANRSDALRVSAPLVDALWDAAPALAQQLAQQALASSTCGTTEACARTVISAAAAKAYRRPLPAAELDELMTVYREAGDFSGGVALALQVVVQSADVLFHTELGDGSAQPLVKLTPYETADALAFLLTGAPPDDALTQAAAAGELGPEAREAHARRLLTLSSAHDVLGNFGAAWLEVQKVPSLTRDATAYPMWPSLRELALKETREFVARAVLDEEAELGTLFTADWSVADAPLATFYGAGAPAAGGRITLPPQRAGVLTHASVLASHAQLLDPSPTLRGHLVRMRLLCQFKKLAPPSDLVITLPPPNPNATSRQRFEGHASNPTCSSCHQHMDPIGFGFEHFDAAGGYRATDNGQSVDATGALTGTDVDLVFDGVPPLAAALAKSEIARDCFSQHWFEFAFAQPIDDLGAPGLCRLRNAAKQFDSGGRPVRELIVDLVKSDLFVTRGL